MIAIKINNTQKNDFTKDYSNGLNSKSLIRIDSKLPSFFTDFLTGTASVSAFNLQVLNISEAKKGRVQVDSENSLSTALILNRIVDSKYQLYFKLQSHFVYNMLYRFKFVDNGVTYISEPFSVY